MTRVLVIRRSSVEVPLFNGGIILAAASVWLENNFAKVSLALVLSVFTGLVMSGTSLGERLGPGTVVGLFAAVTVPGFFVFND